MKMLKELREGGKGEKEQDAMAEFVRLVETTFGRGEKEEEKAIEEGTVYL